MLVRDHRPEHEVRPAREALMNMNWTTITHSHVRERNSPQPSRSSWRKLEAAWRAATGTRTWTTNAALTRNVAASNASAQPAPTPPTTSPARPAPTIDVVLLAQPKEGVRLLQPAGADDARYEAGRGREEERVRDAADDLQDDELPELGAAADQERRDRPLRREHDEVGRRP